MHYEDDYSNWDQADDALEASEDTVSDYQNYSNWEHEDNPQVDPVAIVSAHLENNPRQGAAVSEVHVIVHGWLIEVVDADGNPAKVRYIINRKGSIVAVTASVDIDTNIAHYMHRQSMRGISE